MSFSTSHSYIKSLDNQSKGTINRKVKIIWVGRYLFRAATAKVRPINVEPVCRPVLEERNWAGAINCGEG